MLKKLLFFALFFCLKIIGSAQLIYPAVYVDYDSAWEFNNLKLIPIRFAPKEDDLSASPLVTTMKDGLASGKLTIREIHYMNGSDVNLLQLKNHSDKTIMVSSGEIIIGGKQDRIIGETILLPPHTDDNYVKVYCVEKGRWDDKEKTFKYLGNADVNLRRKVDLVQTQSEVWKEIDKQYKDLLLETPTWSYQTLHKKYGKKDSLYQQFFVQQMKQSDSNFSGFIAISGNTIIGLEMFSSPKLTLQYYVNMLQAFIMSVPDIPNPPSVPIEKVKLFADNLFTNEDYQQKFLKGRGVAHKHKEKTFHIVVYGS